MVRKKAKVVKRHKKIRVTCFLCGGAHSTSNHSFHGVGSFKRTHPKRKRR